MVVVFVVCHTPRLITNFLELFMDQAEIPYVSDALYKMCHTVAWSSKALFWIVSKI
jgi:hypothetical protein